MHSCISQRRLHKRWAIPGVIVQPLLLLHLQMVAAHLPTGLQPVGDLRGLLVEILIV